MHTHQLWQLCLCDVLAQCPVPVPQEPVRLKQLKDSLAVAVPVGGAQVQQQLAQVGQGFTQGGPGAQVCVGGFLARI